MQNYEESIADPCPILPDILTLNSGDKVKTIQEWNAIRKPELITAFESEVYGRIPKLIPSVKWTVDITDREWVGRIPVIAKKLTGHVDNTSFPSVQVNISMVLVFAYQRYRAGTNFNNVRKTTITRTPVNHQQNIMI